MSVNFPKHRRIVAKVDQLMALVDTLETQLSEEPARFSARARIWAAASRIAAEPAKASSIEPNGIGSNIRLALICFRCLL